MQSYWECRTCLPGGGGDSAMPPPPHISLTSLASRFLAASCLADLKGQIPIGSSMNNYPTFYPDTGYFDAAEDSSLSLFSSNRQ